MKSFIINSPTYGKFKVLIDKEDWKRVSKYAWWINRVPGNDYYRVHGGRKKWTDSPTKLHRFILNIKDNTNRSY